MTNSIGVNESIVYSPKSNNRAYQYRSGMGLVPSAEFDVFFDDFHKFVVATSITNGPVAQTPWDWNGAVIDSGSTTTVVTTAAIGATGTLLLSDATASEGVAVYGTKSIQLTAGKKFFMEARVYMDDVTDHTMFMGLSALTATTNPEDLYTTTADDLVAYGILDPATTTTMLVDTGNGGTAAIAGTRMPVVNTWNVFAIAYDGTLISSYLNGKLDVTWTGASTTIPTGIALAPFFAARNGNGAGGNNTYFDYVRYCVER